MTVGASSDMTIPQVSKEDGAPYNSIVAYFSNFGKSVDVFAPGMKIYSTVPENHYESEQGTSMASPVVAGIAALILEYYPNLSAEQVKYCIEKSAVVPPSSLKVIEPYNALPIPSMMEPSVRLAAASGFTTIPQSTAATTF